MMSKNNRLLNITDKDILLLKIFDAVVKAGSFAAAEVCLNKSKSAISIHIATLETRLGKKLCNRGRSGFSLTNEGEEVYKICKKFFADLDHYRDLLNRVSALVSGELTLTIDDSLFGYLDQLEGAIEHYKASSPNVFLSLYTTSPERVMQMLQEGTTDIAVSALPREVSGAEMFPLYSEELLLYCSDKHPLFGVSDSECSDTRIAEFEAVDFGSYQLPSIEEAVCPLNASARSGQSAARLLLILSGKWIGFLPRKFAASWVEAGRLREIRSSDVHVEQHCYAIVRSEIANNEACQLMLASLKQAFALTEKA